MNGAEIASIDTIKLVGHKPLSLRTVYLATEAPRKDTTLEHETLWKWRLMDP
jgi:hypothetical protein